MKRLICSGLASLILLIGCGQPKGKTMGATPKGNPRSILSIQAGDTPQTVTIEGTLVEKCPVAGCWFRLHDGTGVIKVDTKTAGFVVTEIPLQTKLRVGGKVGQEGEEIILEGTGLRF